MLYLWPFIEAHMTGDRAEHHLLDRARDRPARTAFGVGVLTFYVVLFVAGAQDVIAQHLGVSIPSVTFSLRAIAIGLPFVTALLAWRISHDLHTESLRHGEIAPTSWPPVFPAAVPNGEVAAARAAEERRSRLRRAATSLVGVGALVGGFLAGRRGRRSTKVEIRDRSDR